MNYGLNESVKSKEGGCSLKCRISFQINHFYSGDKNMKDHQNHSKIAMLKI